MKKEEFCMKKKISVALIVFTAAVLLLGCSSIPYKEKLILTGLVIDEKGSPVSDFEMRIESPSVKNCTVYTNDSGVFSVNHAKKGKYIFTGKGEGFTFVEEKRDIKSFSNIYCFNVLSGDEVFDQVNQLAEAGEYKDALELLEKLCVNRKTNLYECVSYYRKKIKKEKK